MDVYSCWMFGLSLDPNVFKCTTAEFADQLQEAGIPGTGMGKYYLMPEACTFLDDKARNSVYPYSIPPDTRKYRYGADSCPNAKAFLENFIRWFTFGHKYQARHCRLAAEIVGQVAARLRRT